MATYSEPSSDVKYVVMLTVVACICGAIGFLVMANMPTITEWLVKFVTPVVQEFRYTYR